MKVYIGPYKSYFGPYQLAEKILFWRDKNEDHTVHDLGKKLAKIDWLVAVCSYIDSKIKRKIQVRIDNYDTWSMDDTLAHIVTPMLKQLQKTQHGAPFVDNEDVPEHLRKSAVPPTESEWAVDDENFIKRWDWVLNEMIFAFETKTDPNWEDHFYTNNETNWDALRAHEARVQKGFELFGKYFQSLWD